MYLYVVLVTHEFWIKCIHDGLKIKTPKIYHLIDFLNKMNFSKKCHFLSEKSNFLAKMAIWPPAPGSTASMELFLGLYLYFFLEKKLSHTGGQNFRPNFLLLPTHFWHFLVKRSLERDFYPWWPKWNPCWPYERPWWPKEKLWWLKGIPWWLEGKPWWPKWRPCWPMHYGPRGFSRRCQLYEHLFCMFWASN